MKIPKQAYTREFKELAVGRVKPNPLNLRTASYAQAL